MPVVSINSTKEDQFNGLNWPSAPTTPVSIAWNYLRTNLGSIFTGLSVRGLYSSYDMHYSALSRISLEFDLSSIPVNAIVSSAVLTFSGTQLKDNVVGNDYLDVVGCDGINYNSFGSSLYSDSILTPLQFANDSHIAIYSLNTTGIASFNLGGNTFIGMILESDRVGTPIDPVLPFSNTGAEWHNSTNLTVTYNIPVPPPPKPVNIGGNLGGLAKKRIPVTARKYNTNQFYY